MKKYFKWAGGKQWLAPAFARCWAKLNTQSPTRLVELFCGGLSIGISVSPKQALLNDINPHLINFYMHYQKGFLVAENLLNTREYYTYSRDRFNTLIATQKDNTVEAAVLFYYLNRTGYNGLCRFNKRGFFNVPFGRHASIQYVTEFKMEPHDPALNWTFTCLDFESVKCLADDFIYADPPYDVPFTSYSKNGFDFTTQKRLANFLAQHKGPVITSNQATERMVDLYQKLGFKIILTQVKRSISCKLRMPAKEMIAFKNIDFSL